MSWLLFPSQAFANSAEIGFDVALIVATAVVVVGLIGEYLKTGWWSRHHRLAELLVLAGVAAEVLFEAGSFWYAVKVQGIEGQAIAKAQTKAGDAIIQAGQLGVTFNGLHQFVEDKERTANDEMKGFEQYAAREREKTQAVIAKLNKDRGELDTARSEAVASAKKVGEALATAQTAEKELTASVAAIKTAQQQLHDLTTPRTIDVEHLAKGLKSFGKAPFVVAISEDFDASALAGQIGAALEQAGWEWKENKRSDNTLEFVKRIGNKPSMRIQTAPGGVFVLVAAKDLEQLGRPGSALVDALKGEGLKNVGGQVLSDDDMKGGARLYGVIHIVVGPRY